MDDNLSQDPQEQGQNPEEQPQSQPEPTPPQEPAGEQPCDVPKDVECSQEARNMAMLCHVLGLFTAFLGPLIVWLIKKEDCEYVNEQGKEALNFQITVMIAMVACGILTFFCIGGILALAVWVCNIVFCIMAAMSASKGEHYRYPVSLRLIK